MYKLTLAALLLLVVGYLIYPRPGFPPPPPGSLVSFEPADTESVYRKAYYTNLSRAEVMSYYRTAFGFPNLRTNHPPEEAQIFIRDQTKSSWLEQLIHPWIDSLYINGFYPTKPTEQINIGGARYAAKITVRYVPSHPATRLTVLALVVVSLIWLKKEYLHA